MSDEKTSGIRVFVYGTLKMGHGNNCALGLGKFLGRCYIEGEYRMLDLSWFPGVVRDSSRAATCRVWGEVYLVDEDTLDTLDCIEGHPHFYKREKVETPWKNAWCYFLPEEYLTEGHLTVTSGMWEPTTEEQEFARGSHEQV